MVGSSCVELKLSGPSQLYDSPEGEPLRCISSPSQTGESLDADALGLECTVTLVLVISEHPLPSVAVTEYVPELDTVVELFVDPVLQLYDVPPLAVRVVDSPLHISVSPLMEAVGLELTVTLVLADPVHPLPSVTVR